MSFSFRDACEVLDQQDYAQRLLAAGWSKQPCADCNAVGHFVTDSKGSELFGEGVARAQSRRVCEACRGAGQTWSEPKK